jgi:hypothetical protein
LTATREFRHAFHSAARLCLAGEGKWELLVVRTVRTDSVAEGSLFAMSHPIFPYGPPQRLAEDLWQVEGSLKVPVPRNMTIFRTGGGDLVLYSVIAMHEAGLRALEALGRPAIMVIPHRRHQMDAPFYKARYPALRVLAPEPARVRGVNVDGGLNELEEHGIRAQVLPGNTYEDVVMDMPVSNGRIMVVCESLGNVALAGWLGAVFKVLGPPGGGFGLARAVKLREIRDRPRLRAWFTAQAQRSDVRSLLFGHGAPLTADIPGAFRRAASQV